MAYSYETHTSDGTLQSLILSIKFLSQSEISVFVNGVLQVQPTNYVWATATSIQLTVPVPNGQVLKIQRRTNIEKMRHVFSEGAIYRDTSIDEDYTQILYIAQENLEGRDLTGPLSENLDMGEHRIINLANPIDPHDAVNLSTLQSYAFDSSAVLRADLLANGTQRVYRPGGVVSTEQALLAIEAKNTAQDADLAANRAAVNRRSLAVAVADVHFGVQCGVGWGTLEPGGNVTTTVTIAGSAGALVLNVANGGIYLVGQLIVYTSTDGKRYTAVVVARTASTLTVDRQLRAVALGATVSNFFRDDAHCNVEAAYALTDYTLNAVQQQVTTATYSAIGPELWASVATGVVTAETGSVYTNPGDTPDGGRGARVTSAGVGGGAISVPINLADGDYEVVLAVNVGERAGALSGAVDISVVEYANDTDVALTIGTQSISGYGTGGSQLVTFPVSIRGGSAIRVNATTPNGGSSYFILGQLRVNRLNGYMPSITQSKIVLFGDSWFASGGEVHTAFINRLPNATVISAGVPGNRADQGIARFQADVASQNPDVVIVCFSTNDYYQDSTISNFNQQIHQIRRMIRAIGAIPVFMTSTVGAITPTLPLPNQLTKSRKYAQYVQYRDSDNFATGSSAKIRRFTISGSVSVPAGAAVLVAVTPQTTRSSCWVVAATMNQPLLSMRASYNTAVDGAGEADITSFGTGVVSVIGVRAPRATTLGAPRFFGLRLANATGTPTVTAYSVELEYALP